MNVHARELFARAAACALIAAAGCSGGSTSSGTTTTSPPGGTPEPEANDLRAPGEAHLADIHQLTYDAGENAEAYWAWSGKELIFQSARPPFGCDHIFRVPADGSSEPDLVSPEGGRTTCSFFFPGDKRVLFS